MVVILGKNIGKSNMNKKNIVFCVVAAFQCLPASVIAQDLNRLLNWYEPIKLAYRLLQRNGQQLKMQQFKKQLELVNEIKKDSANLAKITQLLSEGADPNNNFDGKLQSLLGFAIMANRLDIMDTLLIFGADQNQPDSIGRTALEYAVLSENKEACRKLLKRPDCKPIIKVRSAALAQIAAERI